MPVIVFASPKGGAGKSTSALILASELAGRAHPLRRFAVFWDVSFQEPGTGRVAREEAGTEKSRERHEKEARTPDLPRRARYTVHAQGSAGRRR
jgi:Mrp family chromosome partitioning ATPase